MLMLGEDDQLRKAIRLMNPLGEDQSVMRTTLMHSLLNVVATNVSRKVSSGRIFEIGSVYLPKSLPLEELPDEVPHLILCTFGDNEDFYGLKSIVTDLLGYFGLNVKVTAGGGEMFHPYRKANILVRNRNIGQIGEIHPDVAEKYGIEKRVYVAELDITDIFVNANMKKQFKQLPKYPAMDRDIAVVVNEDVEIGPMLESIKSAAGAMLEKVELFDIFRGAQLGEGLKSVAFAMSFRVADRTLTDAEVNEAFNKILKRLESKYNARVR
jgi:phenylalanyl-tRNA synthetase beta chain